MPSQNPLIIAPSVLAADFGRLAEECVRAEKAGADWLHLDVMDGHFVPNISFGPAVTAAIRKAVRLPLDVHLMISHPHKYLEAFVKAGADHIHVHLEADHPVNETLESIRKAGKKAGLAINPETPLKAMKGIDWSLMDLVLVMTVHPGFGGQSFMAEVLPKIEELTRERERRGLSFDVLVDGGIADDTARLSVKAGANVMVAGTSLFSQPDLARAISSMRSVGS